MEAAQACIAAVDWTLRAGPPHQYDIHVELNYGMGC